MDEIGITEFKRKSNKKLTVVLLLLVAIGISIIIFILLDQKNNKKVVEKEEVTDVTKMTDENIIDALREDDLNIDDITDESLEYLELELETVDESYEINLD